MAIGLIVTEPFAEKCRSLCALIAYQVCACKSNGRFFRHKNQLIQSAYDLVGL